LSAVPANELPASWPTTLSEATRIQQELRGRVVLHDDFGQIRTVAGIDAGYEGDLARAVVVVLAFPSLEPLDYAIAWRPAPLPYIPGFLSFREGPAVMAALHDVRVQPDLIICDGQGIAHPRRLGIASHIGVLANIPSIGCAKSLLIGQHGLVPDQRGAHVPLTDAGEVIGAVLRTRSGTKPVYISVGHRVSLEQAIHLVMACTTRYRLPETTRAADGLASHGRIPNIVHRGDSDPTQRTIG
jgi:deoxyribonuclease V